MNDATQALIDRICADAAPVRPFRKGRGLALTGLAFIATVLAVLLLLGARHGLTSGNVSEFFVLVNGLLLVLGLSCVTAVVAMASPQVGASHDGPKWAMAMAGVLPAAAILAIHESGAGAMAQLAGADCMLKGLAASVLVATALFVWLRRGGPVSQNLAGLYLGGAAGALGSVAYGLACPLDSIEHLGIWHVAPVAVGALAGRFAISRWLHW